MRIPQTRRTRTAVASAIVALITVPLSGCVVSGGTVHSAERGPVADPAVAVSPSAQFDSSQFAVNLAAAVGTQNASTFKVSSTVVRGPNAATSLPLEATNSAAGRFAATLSAAASVSFGAQNQLLATEAKALISSGLRVTASSVSVAGTTASGPTVTVNLDIARTLSTGVVWEENVPYVSTLNSSGVVTALVVQDDAWHASNAISQSPEGPATGQSLTSDQLKGSMSSSGFAAGGSSDSVAKTDPDAAQPALSSGGRAAVVNYANRYWNSYNSAYIASPDDCTDFSSQALYAGGWGMVRGFYWDDGSWWYDGFPPLPKSYAWASVQSFRDFAVNQSKRSKVLPSVYDLVPGEILQYGLNNGGAHSMVVTAVSGGQPLLTYHTNNVHNKPFTVVEAIVASHSPTWYALST